MICAIVKGFESILYLKWAKMTEKISKIYKGKINCLRSLDNLYLSIFILCRVRNFRLVYINCDFFFFLFYFETRLRKLSIELIRLGHRQSPMEMYLYNGRFDREYTDRDSIVLRLTYLSVLGYCVGSNWMSILHFIDPFWINRLITVFEIEFFPVSYRTRTEAKIVLENTRKYKLAFGSGHTVTPPVPSRPIRRRHLPQPIRRFKPDTAPEDVKTGKMKNPCRSAAFDSSEKCTPDDCVLDWYRRWLFFCSTRPSIIWQLI